MRSEPRARAAIAASASYAITSMSTPAERAAARDQIGIGDDDEIGGDVARGELHDELGADAGRFARRQRNPRQHRLAIHAAILATGWMPTHVRRIRTPSPACGRGLG